jgi:serine/threonine-protein kinase
LTLSSSPPSSAASAWGPTSLFGYKVEHKLGEGAGSTIWAVTDPKTRQKYALKHVAVKTDKDQRYIEQLKNEFEVSKQYTHPVLRKSIDLKYTKTLFFKVTAAALIMEYCEGVPLDKQPPRNVPEVVLTFLQVARGLDSLHYMGYVHCDMKPSNILSVHADKGVGSIKVIDFGQTAKAATIKDRIQGTADFIAPEQVEKRPITVRTDIFNFGATLYWALSRHKIPTFMNLRKSKRESLRDEHIAPPNQIDPQVPKALSDLVMECIRLDPIDRPRGMGEVVNGLEAIAGKGK